MEEEKYITVANSEFFIRKTQFPEFEDLIQEYSELLMHLICLETDINSETLREFLIDYANDIMELKLNNKKLCD
jgi:hypothetical protein